MGKEFGALHFSVAELVMLVVWAEKVMCGLQVITRIWGVLGVVGGRNP